MTSFCAKTLGRRDSIKANKDVSDFSVSLRLRASMFDLFLQIELIRPEPGGIASLAVRRLPDSGNAIPCMPQVPIWLINFLPVEKFIMG